MTSGRWSGRWVRAAALAAACLWVFPPDSAADKVSTGDSQTDGMVVALQEKLKAVQTCRAHVTTRLKLEGQVYTIQDSGVYRVPGKFRLERLVGEDIRQTLVADGSLLWIHDHSEDLVSRVNLSRVYKATQLEGDGDQPDPTRPFRGIEWTSIRYTGTDTLGPDVCRTFEARAKPISLFAELPVVPQKVRFSVQAEDGLLRRVVYPAPDGDEVLSFQFERVEVNPKLDDRAFEFVVPPRALVMDATDETIALLRTAAGAGGAGE